MTKKIFITRHIPDIAINLLKEKGYIVDIYKKEKTIPRSVLLRKMRTGSYDALLSLLTDRIDGEVLDAARGVRLVANYATGFDNIDITEAKRRGITVTNAPTEESSEAVAEHTIALMLALATKLVPADRYVRRGAYKGWQPSLFVGTSLTGKTVGLVGAGRIGGRVARLCKGLGLSVFYTDTTRSERFEKECDAQFCTTLDELVARVDVISIHVPLSSATHHLIDARCLSLMKKSALLINTARGPIVDEVALVAALRSGRILGAALDVFEHEPALARGLSKLDNVILTPHIASASVEARDAMAVVAAKNIVEFFEGRVPPNAVTTE